MIKKLNVNTKSLLAALKTEKETVSDRQRADARRLSREQVERGMAPPPFLHSNNVEEMGWYEKIKRQDFRTLSSISQIVIY